jgi:hypothetical protein
MLACCAWLWFAQALEDIRRQQAEHAHEHDNDLSDGFEL